MRRILWSVLPALLLWIAARSAAAQPPISGSQLPPDQNNCVICHGDPTLSIWKGKRKRLHIPSSRYEEDSHWKKGVNCHDCHGGDPNRSLLSEAHSKEAGFRNSLKDIWTNCGVCHEEQTTAVRTEGPHATAGEKDKQGRPTPLACNQCHGQIAQHHLPASDSHSRLFIDDQIETCGSCHEEDLKTYRSSEHGQNLYQPTQWAPALCADCHGAHAVYPAPEASSTLHPANVAQTCGKCHDASEQQLQQSVHGRGEGPGALAERNAPGGDEKQRPTCTACHQGHEQAYAEPAEPRIRLSNRCGDCHDDLLRRYLLSLHGQLTELGYAPAAKCSDCHGAHDILPISDPKSRLAPANRLQACRQCHPYAVQNFCSFDPHADHKDPEGYPGLYAVYLGMEILLYGVFGFFGLHTLFWLVRSLIHTLVRGRPKRLAPRQNAYLRFELIHRLLHLIVIVSFLGLALTGLPLRYSDQAWAKTLADALGGFSSTSVWHRIFAVATFSYLAAHLVWLARKAVRLRSGSAEWKTIFLGPDSPVPVWRDVQDLGRMAHWFFGLGPKPVFERWTYWEKFDYWAVFWGVAVIGASGLMLWLPNLFCRFISGEILNAAKVVHSEEALLAVGFIFAVHFFHNAIRPEKAPLDLSMFTGLTSEQEMQEERPEYMERLRRADTLDRIRVTAPSRIVLWLATLGGFAALAMGLSLLAAIIAATLWG